MNELAKVVRSQVQKVIGANPGLAKKLSELGGIGEARKAEVATAIARDITEYVTRRLDTERQAVREGEVGRVVDAVRREVLATETVATAREDLGKLDGVNATGAQLTEAATKRAELERVADALPKKAIVPPFLGGVRGGR